MQVISNVEDVLEGLGLKVATVRGVEIQLNCPAHKERTGREDRNPSLWINSDNGAFICFSCGWKGNIHTLVKYIGGNVDVASTEVVVTGLLARIRKLVAEAPQVEEPTIIHESMLSAFIDVPKDVCLSRGILTERAIEYGLRWNQTDKSWIIPIRNPLTNKLMGWQEKGSSQRIFKNTTGVKKSDALFGYGQYTSGDMIVVESPLDVVRLASVGIPGGVATYGCSISTFQFNLIRGANRVIWALDNDEAGVQATREIRHRAMSVGLECWFFNYAQTDQKDVGGMSKAEIEWGLQNAKHIIRGEK